MDIDTCDVSDPPSKEEMGQKSSKKNKTSKEPVVRSPNDYASERLSYRVADMAITELARREVPVPSSKGSENTPYTGQDDITSSSSDEEVPRRNEYAQIANARPIGQNAELGLPGQASPGYFIGRFAVPDRVVHNIRPVSRHVSPPPSAALSPVASLISEDESDFESEEPGIQTRSTATDQDPSTAPDITDDESVSEGIDERAGSSSSCRKNSLSKSSTSTEGPSTSGSSSIPLSPDLSPVGIPPEPSNPIQPVTQQIRPKPQPIVFYIPKTSIPPATKDASKRSTAFIRIQRVKESKVLSNVLTDDTRRVAKMFETFWRGMRRLNESGAWGRLLSFNQPVLINLKLVQLRSSYCEVVEKATDFKSCCALFEALGMVTISKFEFHKAEAFNEVCTPRFMRNLTNVIEQCLSDRPESAELTRFVENFVDVYGDIILQLDGLVSDDLASSLDQVIARFRQVFVGDDEDGCDGQLEQLKQIIESRNFLIRANSCYPYDILREESVESNVIDGPYDSPDQYLSIHYRLLKEDFQNALREGIVCHVKGQMKSRRKTYNPHLHIFSNVTLVSFLSQYTVKYKIIFHSPQELLRLQDPSNTNFLTGSLLMLTNTSFKDYYLLRVEDRSPLEREKNYIFVSMILAPPNVMFHDTNFQLMAEPTRLFEPYYRVLNMIRSLDSNQLPFRKYIVDVETEVDPPAYMTSSNIKIGNHKVSLWQNSTWPDPASVGLNDLQMEGLKLALRSELAIIQGPPGTGKTYLSRKIVEVLLENKKLWHKGDDGGAGVIVVVCFKNQSLDQLLSGLISKGVKVLRVGTQSKEEKLDAYNLKTLDRPQFSSMFFQMRGILGAEQKELMDELGDSIEIVREIEAHAGVFRYEAFSHLLCLNNQNHSFLVDNYEKWLIDVPNQTENLPEAHRILREMGTWNVVSSSKNDDTDSDFYLITLTEVRNQISKVNKKLDVLVDSGGSPDYIKVLKAVVANLVKKLTFLERSLEKLKNPLSKERRVEMYDFKKKFESDDQPSLEDLPLAQRWALYQAWMFDWYLHHNSIISSLAERSQVYSQRHNEIEELITVRKIAQCDAEVVGLTTTAAAKYHKVMDCIKPKIVLVEEAAEVMEAHTVASLSKHCQHLILVGDHKQLRPLTSSHLIGKEAHLDISMYERLVKNGFPHCTLNTQYRMRPDIAALICPAVYPELINSPEVLKLPHVKGMEKNVYFLDHSITEDVSQDNNLSKWNKHEAEFHLALCSYLVKQGYHPSQITVLATYSEQEKFLNREKDNYPELEDVLMATVDSFQGKENDIILLSLVRSNAEGVIGFLAQKNRVNVALSRAKLGLYITGNSTNLLNKGAMWNEVVDGLSGKKAIGRSLPLKCEIHKKLTYVTKPRDIRALKNGGCSRQCKTRLGCGHDCIHICHPLDRNHETTFKCVSRCSKEMKCSHKCILDCHFLSPDIKCFCESCSPLKECNADLPCGHKCSRMAHAEDTNHQSTYQCPKVCETTLKCGHICMSQCHVEDPEHVAAYKCPIVCYGDLFCGHDCRMKYHKNHQCYEHKVDCGEVCNDMMECGHPCLRVCHLVDRNHKKEFGCMKCFASSKIIGVPPIEVTPTTLKPTDFCVHGHLTWLGICRETCGFELKCGHSCDKKCQHIVDNTHQKLCNRMCGKTLSCGHSCTRLCHFKLSKHTLTDLCKLCMIKDSFVVTNGSMVATEEQLLTSIEPTQKDEVQNLAKCGVELKCGHVCGRKRGTHVHVTNQLIDINSGICKRECGARLSCGHNCTLRCHFKFPTVHQQGHCFKCKKEGHNGVNWKTSSVSPLVTEEEVKVRKEMCSHGKTLNSNCAEPCGFKYPCGHHCGKKCHRDTGFMHRKRCKQSCNAALACGHKCRLICHFGSSDHSTSNLCSKCVKINKPSALKNEKDPVRGLSKEIRQNYYESSLMEVCSHGNAVKWGCPKKCEKKFECGHLCRDRCLHQRDIKHKRECISQCGTVLLCGHICKILCHYKTVRHQPSDSCSDCLAFAANNPTEMCSHGKSFKFNCNGECSFTFKCGHNCMEKCGHSSTIDHSLKCSRKCDMLLSCGHRCTLSCHVDESFHDGLDVCQSCSGFNGEKVTEVEPDEGVVYCSHKKNSSNCSDACPGKMPCGHKCPMNLRKMKHTCSKHYENGAFMCQKKCRATLACCHVCAAKCHMGGDAHVCKKCDYSFILDPCVVQSRKPEMEVKNGWGEEQPEGDVTVEDEDKIMYEDGSQPEKEPDAEVSEDLEAQPKLKCGEDCITVPVNVQLHGTMHREITLQPQVSPNYA